MEASNQPKTYNGAGDGKKTSIRVGAVIVLALVVGFVAWILIDRSGSDSASTTTPTVSTPTTGPAVQPVGPAIVSQAALAALAGKLGHPVYWAGPISGQKYEYTLTNAGRAYVRYLPSGAKAGDPRANFLIIATYPFPKAFTALKKVSKGAEVEIPGGGIALVDKGYPQSVHFAFPGADYQGEVYDPSAKKALAVATSGDLRPVS